jgi:hypothetical protein
LLIALELVSALHVRQDHTRTAMELSLVHNVQEAHIKISMGVLDVKHVLQAHSTQQWASLYVMHVLLAHLPTTLDLSAVLHVLLVSIEATWEAPSVMTVKLVLTQVLQVQSTVWTHYPVTSPTRLAYNNNYHVLLATIRTVIDNPAVIHVKLVPLAARVHCPSAFNVLQVHLPTRLPTLNVNFVQLVRVAHTKEPLIVTTVM